MSGTDATDAGEAETRSHPPLSERVLDLFVYLPTGLVVTVADELPRLTERGRARLGIQVGSARAVGQFVVQAGGDELKRRAGSLRTRPEPATAPSPATAPAGDATSAPAPALRTIPGARLADRPTAAAPSNGTAGLGGATAATPPAPATPPASSPPSAARSAAAHIPDVASLAIPGFDTLSASQVVQRLDGLDRTELVAVRAYESACRGRRTILSRVDQLLELRA